MTKLQDFFAIASVILCGISFQPVQSETLEDTAKRYISDNNMICDTVSHVEVVQNHNDMYYDITCQQASGYTIFKIIPLQVVMTHYLGE